MRKLKYKVGDRVRIKSLDWYNENKNPDYGFVYLGNGICFYSHMSIYCGKTMTISEILGCCYRMVECIHDDWTDEMIEGLVEEETKVGTASNPIEPKSNANCMTQKRINETKPKFKIGDKIINGKTQLTILSIMSDKYIVEDNFGECGVLYFNIQDNCKLIEDDIIDIDEFQDDSEMFDIIDEYIHRLKGNECQIDLPEGYQFTDEDGNIINAQKIILEKKSPKTDDITEIMEMNDMKRNACQKCAFAVYNDNPHCGLRGFRSSFNVEWCSAENDTAPNGYELQEDGYFSWVKKKKEYPKTYEECCTVLRFHYDHYLTYDDEKDINPTKEEEEFINLMDTFSRLIVCRNAYWKLYGEEMGLGKPWKPDWKSSEERKYSIVNIEGNINLPEITLTKWILKVTNKILVFPTEEMRDAFYENFKELIESCKELL